MRPFGSSTQSSVIWTLPDSSTSAAASPVNSVHFETASLLGAPESNNVEALLGEGSSVNKRARVEDLDPLLLSQPAQAPIQTFQPTISGALQQPQSGQNQKPIMPLPEAPSHISATLSTLPGRDIPSWVSQLHASLRQKEEKANRYHKGVKRSVRYIGYKLRWRGLFKISIYAGSHRCKGSFYNSSLPAFQTIRRRRLPPRPPPIPKAFDR